ncbi:helix-turn-helix transcriptional regulator [Embleya sp. NBC_00888]|uniref:helix-turn-helix domain-containing protein n=1 Tax=Embleya sp. NBC_00888 TaxID=2975960 RepID=UPI003870DB89|nr:helix-turn-helix transcriptional regulator [Embleya sp. NBC_00888]
MTKRADLGAFLRSRRARLKPEDVGLTQYGERRRVPGLRREELARLAGVSVDYYVRFEQGRAENVSDEVLDAIASALRLNRDEHGHLRDLVRAMSGRRGAGATSGGPVGAAGGTGVAAETAGSMGSAASVVPAQEVRPGVRRLLASMPETPAFVMGRRTDLLAWNPLFATLFIDVDTVPIERRNKAWLVIRDERLRARYVNWETKAQDVVAYLRLDAGRHPEDPAFAELISELSESSPDFRRLWATHEVRDKTHGGYHLRHPAIGELTLSYESFRTVDDPDQTLVTYTAEADSPSEAALRILANRAHPTSTHQTTPGPLV